MNCDDKLNLFHHQLLKHSRKRERREGRGGERKGKRAGGRERKRGVDREAGLGEKNIEERGDVTECTRRGGKTEERGRRETEGRE